MAEDKGQDRTEQATPKRLREAAEKGQIARSREATTLAMLMATSVGFMLWGDTLAADLGRILTDGLSVERAAAFDMTYMITTLTLSAKEALIACAPIVALLVITALFAPAAVSGLSFSTKALAWKNSRINPISGMKRIFSANGLLELLKSLAKFLLVTGAAVLLFNAYSSQILSLAQEPLGRGVAHAGNILVQSFLLLSASLVVVAIIDVPFQLWNHARQLKMTKQEVKDEQKETDGNPQLKGRQRELQRKLAQQQITIAVPAADVIIVNPTHYAVAIKYDHDNMPAPTVVAKGVDYLALRIREIGKASRVPIVYSPLLARVLYSTTDVNRQIPHHLFVAVAEVLAYVYRLRESGQRFSGEPIDMTDLNVPDTDYNA